MEVKIGKKLLIIIALSIFMIIFTIFFYGNSVMRVYDLSLNEFKDITLTNAKKRLVSEIDKLVYSFDIGRETKVEEYRKAIDKLTVGLYSAVNKRKINDFKEIINLDMIEVYKDFTLKFLIYDLKEESILLSNDETISKNDEYSMNELGNYILNYEYTGKIMNHNEDKLLIVGVRKQDIDEEYKLRAINLLKRMDFNKDIDIWIDQLPSENLDYSRILEAKEPSIERNKYFFSNKDYEELIYELVKKENILIYHNISIGEERDVRFQGKTVQLFSESGDSVNIIKSDEGYKKLLKKMKNTVSIDKESKLYYETRPTISVIRLYDKFNWSIGMTIDLSYIKEIENRNIYGFKKALVVDIAIIYLLLTIAIILLIIIFNYYEHVKRRLVEKEKLLIQNHYFIIENKYNRTNQIIHDIKDHFICIQGLANHINAKEIISYVNNMNIDFAQLKNIVISGNKIVDIIINHKICIMENENIDFKYDIENINIDFVHGKDLSVILGNMLNNAIESSKKSETKKVSLKLYTFNEKFVIIKIENSCSKSPIQKNGRLRTTKVNKECHGYGMLNIKFSLRKYNGNITWSYDEEKKLIKFIAMIPKN